MHKIQFSNKELKDMKLAKVVDKLHKFSKIIMIIFFTIAALSLILETFVMLANPDDSFLVISYFNGSYNIINPIYIPLGLFALDVIFLSVMQTICFAIYKNRKYNIMK